MNDEQRQSIFEHLNNSKKMIKNVRDHLGHMDGVTVHLRSAEIEILTAIDNIKRKYQKEEPRKKETKKETKKLDVKV